MSKFFITNNYNQYQAIKGRVESSSYKIAFEYNSDNIYALTTKKLTVDNINGIKCDDGFVVVTGTMAWGNGEPINVTSLQEIYQQFDNDINHIRRDSIGNYATCILKENKLYVFGEVVGFYNIYYYCCENDWVISNSLYDLAKVLKDKVSLNKLALIEATVQGGLLLDDTFYNEVKRLSGFNYLKVTPSNFEVVEETQSFPMAEGTIEEKVDRYVELMKDYGRKMSRAYGTPAISMTGGLDARMVMSTYLSAGIKPHLYYGTGNSFITNTFDEDKEIDKIFADKYGLSFHNESWATPEPFDKDWDKYLNLYGFYYDTYAGAEDVFESIRNNNCQLFTLGYCGELLRNLPWIESKVKTYFTLKEYIEELYVPDSVRNAVVCVDDYLFYIQKKLEKICQHYQLDINHIENEDVFYLSLERRKSADASMLNLVNFMKYSCYTLGQKQSLNAARITCQEAENSSFMLRCLFELYPSVLEVPVFSHCTMRKFYRETMSLNPQSQPLSRFEQFKGFLRNNLHWVWKIARKMFPPKKWRFEKDQQIFDQVLSLYNQYDTYAVINPDKLQDKRDLVNFVMKIYAFKQARE